MRIYAIASIFLLLMVICNTGYGQKRVGFGLTSGFTSSSFYSPSSRDISINNRWSMPIGGFIDLKLAEVINVQTAINYSQRGASVIITQGEDEDLFPSDVSPKVKWRTSYFEVPLLFRITFPYKTPVVPHLIFGPSFNFLGHMDVSNTQIITDNTRTIKEFDLATVFGAGTSFQWNYPGEFFVDVRYMLGTTDVHQFFDVDLRNESISLNLGYQF
ncbi:MAG: porin family protein [Balneolales bacterium]